MPPESKAKSELDFLSAIERGEVVTQMTLAKRIGVSIGLINALLKRATHKGFVKARKVPYKRYAYYLTPRGFGEKSRLVAEYLDHSLQFYRTARSEYVALFEDVRKMGLERLVLVGGDELAEIAILAAWGEDVTLLALVDPQANQPRRYGLEVIRSVGEVADVDGLIITDARTPQKTYEAMRACFPDGRVLAPPLLKITRDRAGLMAAARRVEGGA